ncbi:MAG: toll/interleukin-1 receptor domain-containing protein [Thermoanaerobaculia bacterium]
MSAVISDHIEELDTRIAAYPELLLLGQQWDPESGLIQFADGEDIYVRAKGTLIGSWGRSGSWRWAWPNDSLPPAARNASLQLKELAQLTGRAEFLSENAFPATAVEARKLVAAACHHLDAASACNVDSEQAVWWFALHDIEHLRPLDALVERAAETAAEVLAQGHSVMILNALRARFPTLKLELIGEDLRGRPRPWAHDLHAQILFDYDQMETHERRDFSGANLSHSRFDESILRGIVFQDGTFEGASLVDTDLSRADLRGVSFKSAFLNGTNFNRAQLAGADFTDAELSRTLLTDVDLSEVKGLDTVHHMTPSEISLSTLTASRFKLSPAFLRRAGVSRGLIEDLANGQRFAHQYETCFLSYSSKDVSFAEKLYRSLEDAGVRVFWDRFDVLPGESLRDQIIEAIREHDRLIVVLSANGMASDWVRQEIELAWYHKRDSLVPIRLCEIDKVRAWTAKHEKLPDLARLFPVLDFSAWGNEREYAHAVALLLRSLAGGADLRPETQRL